MTSLPSIEPGLRIGNYVLEEPLGTGSEGLVFLARDVLLGRRVAIKTVRGKRNDHTHGVEEARTLARLEHPHIVRVYHAERNGSSWFIVYEYVAGGTLHDWVERSGPVAMERALTLATQAAHGLAFAHGQGTLHRDVKPQNLMLSGDGWLKIGDFGLALDLRSQNLSALPNAGTPAFLAPELWCGAAPTTAADVYSLGACIYFMLKGHPPFIAREVEALRRAHCHQSPELDAEWPVGVRELLMAMLDKEPSSRPDSLKELAEWLLHLQRNPLRPAVARGAKAPASPIVADGMALGLHAAFQNSPHEFALAALERALQRRCRGVILSGGGVGDSELLVRAAATHCECVAGTVFLRLPHGKQSLLRSLRAEVAGATAAHTLQQLVGRLRDQQVLGRGQLALVVTAEEGLSPQQFSELRELLACAEQSGLTVIQVGPDEAAVALRRAEPDLMRVRMVAAPGVDTERSQQLSRFAYAATGAKYWFSVDGMRVLHHICSQNQWQWADLACAAIEVAANAGSAAVVPSWAVLAAQAQRAAGAERMETDPLVAQRPRCWPDEETMALLRRLRHQEVFGEPVPAQAVAFGMGELRDDCRRGRKAGNGNLATAVADAGRTSRMSHATDL